MGVRAGGCLHLDVWQSIGSLDRAGHLRFKQAQPKICHSPKIEDGGKNHFLLLGPIFVEN